MKLKTFFLLSLLPVLSLAQEQAYSNRYGMKMTQNADGSYALLSARKYAKFSDMHTIPELLVPYTHRANRLQSKDYKGIVTKEIVYKKHHGYELTLSIDLAESVQPAPFVVYLHGGGWARGNNASSKTLSQYLAKQKGITGVRVSYTLAPQPGATVEVTIQDIKDAVGYVQEHATELNIDPHRFAFLGTSAGAHLAAVAALTTPGTRALVGYSGIYDLETASITAKTKDPERIAYFCNKDPKVMRQASPLYLISQRSIPPAAMLVCGTHDVTVECEQSRMFAAALCKRKGVCDLLEYRFYDHNLSSKSSDKMEEIFFKSVEFLTLHLQ